LTYGALYGAGVGLFIAYDLLKGRPVGIRVVSEKQIAAAVGSASKVKYYLPLVWHASSQFVEITAAVTSHNARRLGLVRRGCFNSG